MVTSFRGGIYLTSHKDQTARKRVEAVGAPEELIAWLPEGGVSCVAAGERVLRGQCIADSADPDITPVHTGISGTVSAVETRRHPSGGQRLCIIIENDHMGEELPVSGVQGWETASPETLLDAIRAAGIPEQARLRRAEPVDTVIISGVESVPYEAATYRVMLEQAGEIADGARVLHRIFPCAQIVIGVEERRSDALALMRRVIRNEASMRVEGLSPKYPQGHEAMLVRSITGRRLLPGQLPEDAGCVVLGVAAAASIARAVLEGLPETDCTLTVAGAAVAVARNLRVPVGTPLKVLADACGGLSEEPAKVIVGDSVRGCAQPDLRVSVDKGTRAVLFFDESETGAQPAQSCIRCGRCVEVCPMGLMPGYLYEFARKGLYADCKGLRIRACIECGACGCVCPGGLPIPDMIRQAKKRLGAE